MYRLMRTMHCASLSHTHTCHLCLSDGGWRHPCFFVNVWFGLFFCKCIGFALCEFHIAHRFVSRSELDTSFLFPSPQFPILSWATDQASILGSKINWAKQIQPHSLYHSLFTSRLPLQFSKLLETEHLAHVDHGPQFSWYTGEKIRAGLLWTAGFISERRRKVYLAGDVGQSCVIHPEFWRVCVLGFLR